MFFSTYCILEVLLVRKFFLITRSDGEINRRLDKGNKRGSLIQTYNKHFEASHLLIDDDHHFPPALSGKNQELPNSAPVNGTAQVVLFPILYLTEWWKFNRIQKEGRRIAVERDKIAQSKNTFLYHSPARIEWNR